MGNFYHSLRFRAFAVTFVSFAALFALVIVNTNHQLDAVAVENINSNIRQTSETMNLALAPYTTLEGLEALNDYLQELISGGEVGIIYLAIVDEKGELVLRTETTPAVLPEPTPQAQYLVSDVIHIAQPTLLYGNQIGMLRFGMTWKKLHEGIDAVNREIFTLLSIGFVLITALLFYLVFRIINRLSTLLATTRELEQGNYAVRAYSGGRDEICSLAQHFNQMAVAIEEHISDIERLNENLEDRVKERTAELAEALENLKKTQDELVQSEKLAGLGSIVAAVAHELNTPIGNAMTVATSFAEKTRDFENHLKQGLKRSTLNEFTESVYAAADLLERNLGKASELILSFKNVAIDQTSSKRRRFDLADTINEIVSTLRPTFKKSGHELMLNLTPGVEMDSYPGPIGQVITNLINNAILHGFEGIENGTMKLSCDQGVNGWATIVFSDNGVGISQENIKQVFDPFFTTQLGKGGSGLGMNIVHNIVTALLGGSIVVESPKGKGAIFTIVLPMTAPQSEKDADDPLLH